MAVRGDVGVARRRCHAPTAAARPGETSERLVLALLSRLTPELRSGFSEAQVAALKAAAQDCAAGRHPLDWSFRLRTPLGRFYLRLVGGPDRRR